MVYSIYGIHYLFLVCLIVDAVDTSKKGHKGKAWLGSDRDYIYDEVSRGKNLENEKKSGQPRGKVREFYISVREIRKNETKSWKSQKFQNFKESCLLTGFWKFYFP